MNFYCFNFVLQFIKFILSIKAKNASTITLYLDIFLFFLFHAQIVRRYWKEHKFVLILQIKEQLFNN